MVSTLVRAFHERLDPLEPSLIPNINAVKGAEEDTMNGLIYLVGLVVIVGIILSFFGLR